MKKNLLEGNIRSQLIVLALPLLLGSLLQQLYNTVDSLIIANFLGEEAFSAVGIAGTVMNLFIFVLAGFCTGVSVLMGQLYGSGDRGAFRREVFISVTLGGGITILLSALSLALMHPLLVLINSPAELIPQIQSYLTVIIGGMLATYFYNLFSGMLRSIGDTRAATVFLLISVLFNAATDYLFVGVWHMGVSGAAWATVLSQILSTILCLAYILKRDRELICTRADCGLDRGLVTRTLSFGFTSALHQSALFIGKVFVQGAVNTLGTSGIAAFTAASRVEGFANSFGIAMGSAISVLISQNWGAGNQKRVRDGFRQGIFLSVLMGAVLMVIMYITARPGVTVFLGSETTKSVTYGMEYLRQIAVFYILCFTGNAYVGYYRGIGRMYIPLCGTIMHVSIRVAFSYILVSSIGLRAVGLATGFGWIALFTLQTSVFFIINRNKRKATEV